MVTLYNKVSLISLVCVLFVSRTNFAMENRTRKHVREKPKKSARLQSLKKELQPIKVNAKIRTNLEYLCGKIEQKKPIATQQTRISQNNNDDKSWLASYKTEKHHIIALYKSLVVDIQKNLTNLEKIVIELATLRSQLELEKDTTVRKTIESTIEKKIAERNNEDFHSLVSQYTLVERLNNNDETILTLLHTITDGKPTSIINILLGHHDQSNSSFNAEILHEHAFNDVFADEFLRDTSDNIYHLLVLNPEDGKSALQTWHMASRYHNKAENILKTFDKGYKELPKFKF